ncbi:alcohol dehydrogenase catalytic domain-containing protein [Alloacidobacterium dinghuense]|uniref:Alcohol dehydrogenase catalytic domain-containing protein n=1 Tax=Alloacidobacterium dinghuense TaxID=2763107 RepID=A0A7G8BKC0_9BACT|nr:zinc-dependent dehydrogenase [Alloacidobacterium dinghuense]QNI32990.1 alcohol dehydrogenase catalytic domain-containing protein [Alloacidobacterium dinghuense]
MSTFTTDAPATGSETIPAFMQAVVYRAVNDVRVETIPVPEIGPGEILIRVHSCGICGTDLKKIHTGSHSAPRIFGHETSGTIVKTGEGISNFAVGDRVMVFHHIPCGKCYYCRKKTFAQCATYKKVGCTAGFEPSGGGFAEYIRVMDWIVSMGGVLKIPDGVPFEQAAFVEPINTCLKAIKNLNLALDETVLVVGQGPIGIMLAALAARTGAKILTSDLYPERHAIAAAYGLNHPIDAGKENVIEVAKRESEGRGADAVILAVGGNALIRTAMDAARPGGRVLLFAQTQHSEAMIDPAAVCMDEKTLLGSYSASVEIQDEGAQLVFDGYRNGFDLTRLISHRFPLEEAVEAIEVASNPTAASMKVFIQPNLRK